MREEGKVVAEQTLVNRERERMSAHRSNPQVESNQSSWFWKLSVGFLFLCILVWAWVKATNPATFAINSVHIEGNYVHVDRNLLRQTILPYVQNGLLRSDLSGLQDRLSQLPWVYQAKVQRIWPHELKIAITEQQAAARYGAGALVNTDGDLYSVDQATIPSSLPQFTGPQGQQKLMLQTYQQMVSVLAPLGVKITHLTLDARQAWQLQLDNGLIVLVGKIDPLTRLQRFVGIYSQIVNPKLAAVQSVDLRYTTGIAVRFADQTSEFKNKVI